METLFFTIVALFFLGIAIYYFFQRGKQGSFLPKKKHKPETILPESQLYAGSDGAPTLEQALEEIQEEPAKKESLPDDQTVQELPQEPFSDNQDSADDQSKEPDMYLEKPEMDLNKEINENQDKGQETEQKL